MIKGYLWTLDGHAVVACDDYEEWMQARVFADHGAWVVDQDTIDGILVSTAFLGINFRSFGPGPPLVFETAIWGDECRIFARTATWAEAEDAHALAQVALHAGIRDVWAEIDAALTRPQNA